MTESEFRALMEQRLPDNTTGQITPADVRAILLLLVAVLIEGGFEPEA